MALDVCMLAMMFVSYVLFNLPFLSYLLVSCCLLLSYLTLLLLVFNIQFKRTYVIDFLVLGAGWFANIQVTLTN